MKHGFVKVAAATPDIRVADVEFNTAKICEAISEACEQKAKIIVFPELCVTGYTCGDLFTQDVLLKAAKDALIGSRNIRRIRTFLLLWERLCRWAASCIMWRLP